MKKRLFRALSPVPLSVCSGMQLLPKDARERRSPSDSSGCKRKFKTQASTVSAQFEGCRQTPRAVRLRSPRLSVQRSLGLSERKKRLFRALSPVPLSVCSGMQLLPKDARERRSPSDSSVSQTSASLEFCVFAESFFTMSCTEKLCQHGKHIPISR
ncbi:unnamed protein product [Coccothraustes coccothraustes]